MKAVPNDEKLHHLVLIIESQDVGLEILNFLELVHLLDSFKIDPVDSLVL